MKSSSMTTSSSSPTRRRVLKSTAALAGVLAMPAVIGRAAAQGDAVRILGLATAQLDDWSPFEKETGLKVEYTPYGGADPGADRQEIMANAAGDRYDLFIMSGSLGNDVGPPGFLMPLTGENIPNWSEVPDYVMKSPLARGPDGTQWGLPVVMNADSFGYLVDEIDEKEPLSWSVLFENSKALGRAGLENEIATTFTMAAMYVKAKGETPIKDPANLTPEEAKAVADFLIARKRAGQFRAMWTTWEESIDLFARGEVIVCNVWEPAVRELQRKGLKIRYAYTREGYFKWLQAAYVPSQVQKRGSYPLVAKALEGFLGGAYAARIAILRGYATANAEAGLEYAKENGLPSRDIEAIEANIRKVKEKFSAPLVWYNGAPTYRSAMEAEFDRFRSA
jgi:putative spermidine/putrescine transport system substrate-binding protein